jgi:uncharacterized membrane protein
MVLRTVQGDSGGQDAFFVPHLAVTGAVALTLFSLGLLIFYVHHVAVRMQVSEITAAVARDLERAIERLYPDRLGEHDESAPVAPPEPPDAARAIPAVASGYLQEIDARAILEAARRHHTTLWLFRRPGDFVVEGTVIARAHPAPRDERAFTDAVSAAFVVGADRTSNQDAAFAVQQLVEVSLRALSPGVNEAFTAITCIDRLGQGLSKILTRRIPAAIRTDQDGAVRVIARPYTFDELACAAFKPIAVYAERNPAIYARLLETLASLAEMARRPEDRRAIASIADFVCEVGEKQAAYDWDRVVSAFPPSPGFGGSRQS